MKGMFMLRIIHVLLAVAGSAAADVYYVEEVVNAGFGSKKAGARKTTQKIYLKNRRQKIESEIKTDKQTASVLRKQGQALKSSTIVQLDTRQVYEIDIDRQTYTQAKLQPAAKKAAKKAVAKPGAPEIKFKVKSTKESKKIAGILCKKVVAQMRAQYRDPKTKKALKENRYIYTAWVAKDFPGYKEIAAFQKLQAAQTAYPSLIGGDLETLRGQVDDFETLEKELKALDGFIMASTLEITVQYASTKKKVRLFKLDRMIKSYSHKALAKATFEVSGVLTQVKEK